MADGRPEPNFTWLVVSWYHWGVVTDQGGGFVFCKGSNSCKTIVTLTASLSLPSNFIIASIIPSYLFTQLWCFLQFHLLIRPFVLSDKVCISMVQHPSLMVFFSRYKDGKILSTAPSNPKSHLVILPTGSLFLMRVMQNKVEDVSWKWRWKEGYSAKGKMFMAELWQ